MATTPPRAPDTPRRNGVPSNLVAKAFGSGKEEYLEVEDRPLRTAPTVDFS